MHKPSTAFGQNPRTERMSSLQRHLGPEFRTNLAWCITFSKDGERTLIGEDNYSKVFLMRMPIMVRTTCIHEQCLYMAGVWSVTTFSNMEHHSIEKILCSVQFSSPFLRTEYCWLKNANDRTLVATGIEKCRNHWEPLFTLFGYQTQVSFHWRHAWFFCYPCWNANQT